MERGIVREAIRAIQDERKTSGFDVSDRIHVKWNSDEQSSKAIEDGAAWISEELLALSFERDVNLKPGEQKLGLHLKLNKA